MERLIVIQPRHHIRLWDYVRLTKPRIISLLLITAYCAMVVARGGWPAPIMTLNALGGLSLSIAGAHAINMWYDRDIDRLMERTRHRPVPLGRIAPLEALSFGIFLETVSFAWLSTTVNRLTAGVTLAGFLFYVLVYTMWLKRRSPQNIVIGGAAGAFPPLVGWAAVTNHLSWVPWLMFLIIFLWTPPHFWALALYRQQEYRDARIPMMPIVHGIQATTRQMVSYAALMVLASIALYEIHPGLGPIYLIAALLLGLMFWLTTLALFLSRPWIRPEQVFLASLLYMAGLFGTMVAGVMLG